MDDVGGFIKQVPIGLLLAPVVFGVLYILVMIFIFRRAAERRRRKAEGLPPISKMKAKNNGGNFFNGRLPNKPLEAAAWSVPTALRGLPEPDLEMLSSPALLTEPETVESAMTAPTMDWLAMIAPVPQEITMSTTKLPTSDADKGKKTVDLTDAIEVMRVWRDLSDGSLIIQMGEQRYRSVSEITNADLGRRFTAVVRELWTMINNGVSSRPSGSLTASDSPLGVPPPEGSAGGMKARIGMLNPPPDPEEQKAKPGFMRQVARTALGQSSVPAQPEPARRNGIADAVEEYLQFKLTNTPQFQARSIHVRPSIDGGVRIDVDGHYYDGIGDVIDADVRDFLFGVLREWEARQ